MSDTIRTALLFLINTLFDLYLFILVVRVVLVAVHANYFDPIVQFIVKMTNFLVKPLRRVIPTYRNIELATIVLILGIELIKFLFISLLSVGFPNIAGLFVLAFADAIKISLQTFFYGILLQAILSWVQPMSPANYLLSQFNAPVLRPFQRLIPLIGGIDISPIPAMIVLQLLIIIIANPLMMQGSAMAFS